MHSAPAVSYPVGPWSMRPLYLSALAGGSLAAAAFWLQQPAAFGVPAGGILLSCLACLGVTVWASRRDHAGVLKWSAGKWAWDSGGRAHSGELTVLADLQRVVVVVVRCDDGREFWFCLHRRADPALWPALRRALASASGHLPKPADRANAGTPP